MRVPVVGLLGRTGERRGLATDVDPAELGDDPWGGVVEGIEGPIGLDLVLEAVSDGILVRGDVTATLRIPCGRCLTATLHPRRVGVTELHRRTVRGPVGGSRGARGARSTHGSVEDEPADDVEGEEYLLVDGDTALELDRMVRDALLLDVPVRVLCRPDCAGLCPACGADRNRAPCTHGAAPAADPRWAALEGLRERLAGGDGPAVAG